MTIRNLLLIPAIIFSLTVQGQNVFPGSGNAGIGISNPETFLHIKANGTAAYPSKSTRGNVMQLFQGDNNGLEIGVANGTNTRRAWLLARHVTVPQYGEHYSTLHLQPKIDVMDYYRGVGIGYPANLDVPWGVGLVVEGKVGIGTLTPQEKLSVNGKIRAHEIKVETANWPDYVFNDNYELKSLDSLRTFITRNGHLPEVPSAKTVESEGVDLGEMNKLLLKKIEELTLYLLQKDKEIVEIKQQLKQLTN